MNKSLTAVLACLFFSFCAIINARETIPELPNNAPQQLKDVKAINDSLSAKPDPDYATHLSRSEMIQSSFAALTGEAVNPLFGVTVRSAYVYIRTDESSRCNLAWYYQPQVWGPLAVIILMLLFKSTVIEAFPPLKKPLDALAELTHKTGAVVSLPIVLAMFAQSFSTPAAETIQAAHNFVSPAAYAAETGAAGAAAYSTLGWIVSLTLGFAIYCIVFIAFSTIEVLILISPLPAVDAFLKSFRIAVIGLIFGLRAVSPMASAVLSIMVILFSLLIAGWSLRLSIFGWIYSIDMLLFRSRRMKKVTGKIRAFSNSALTEKMPIRTMGLLEKTAEGKLLFSYRPWLILPKKTLELPHAPNEYNVGSGLLNPYLVRFEDENFSTFLRFPPRYKRHEEELATLLTTGGVRDVSLTRSISMMFRYLKSLITGTEMKTAS